MQHVKEVERKTSSLKRGIRFATVVFNGHLFDTKFFNNAIDIFEELKIDFRVVEWQVGTHALNTSQVTMQLMAQEAKTMDLAKERIEQVAKEKNVIINEGHGPAFDAPQASSESSLLDDDTK
jgi:ACT domain-containing protein